MALKAATDFQADATYTYLAVQTQAKKDGIGADAEQKRSPEGTPLWTVDAIRQAADGSTALVSVTVPAATQPDVLGHATLHGLRMGLWLSRDRAGQGGIYWQADAITPAQPARKAD